ncbi:four helix bundle protein [Terrimonas alba]|uniref:four helix bundle protein n=1 Tax=Terrimonas alba TaxID=3349636 RepID=UPI0035F434B8
MFLNLNHKSLTAYSKIRELTKEVYKVSNLLPVEEKFNMVQQTRRAALSVKLNFSEGSTRKSLQERKRYYEIARGSLVEIDAALETAVDLQYFKTESAQQAGVLLNECFAILSKMMK